MNTEQKIETSDEFIDRIIRTYEFGFSHGLDKYFRQDILNYIKKYEISKS